MRAEVLAYLFVAIYSAGFAQNTEVISDALTSKLLPRNFTPETETTAVATERSFVVEHSAETIVPRERGFPFPGIKPARELGAPMSTSSEPGDNVHFRLTNTPSTTAIGEITTATSAVGEKEISDYKFRNITSEKTELVGTTNLLGITKVPQVDLVIDESAMTADKADVTAELQKQEFSAAEENTPPPEEIAVDPFATTDTEEEAKLTLAGSEENIQKENYNNASLRASVISESIPSGTSSSKALRTSAELGSENESAASSDSATNFPTLSMSEHGSEAFQTSSESGSENDAVVSTDSITDFPTLSASEHEVEAIETGSESNLQTDAVADADLATDFPKHSVSNYETPNTRGTNELEAVSDVSSGTESTAPEAQEHIHWSSVMTLITETTPDVFETTAVDGATDLFEHSTESTLLHPAVSHVFSADSEERSSTTMHPPHDDSADIIAGEVTSAENIGISELANSFQQPSSKAVAESYTRVPLPEPTHEVSVGEEATRIASTEIRQESMPTTSSTSKPVTVTTTGFIRTEGHDHDYEHEDEHDDESLFVGDKSLFSQDKTIKTLQELSTKSPISDFSTHFKPENLGSSGFSRIEESGPEATEDTHQDDSGHIDAGTFHDATKTSSDTETEVPTEIPIDFIEENGELKENGGKPEPTLISVPEPESTPESEPEPEPTPVSEPTPEPEPVAGDDKAETSKTDFEPSLNELIPKAEPEPEPNGEEAKASEGNTDDSSSVLHTYHTHVTDSGDISEGAYKTPFLFRITNIDYLPEFGDPESGKHKKLRDQLIPDLEEIFGSLFGQSYEGVHLVSFTKGSVVVEGVVYTSKKPEDMEQLTTEFEQQVTARNSQIGGNSVDPRSISLNGYVSKNYIERVHEGYTSSNTSSYIVGGGIAIGILSILLIAFAVIASRKTDYPFMNNRRTNGTLKLKEENVAMAESGRSPWQNGTSPVNLRGYGNGRTMQEGLATNGQPPMVMIGSQMTPIHMHAAQPCP